MQADRRRLVVLQLVGGNDCLNTFIPYTDPKYRAARPTLAIADQSILKISDRIGFHPSMQKLESLYTSGKLAFINNVGFASLDRSHFRCRDIWQTGVETSGSSQESRGWLGRYADSYLATGAATVTAFGISPQAPLGLSASGVIGTSITSPDVFDASTTLVVTVQDPMEKTSYRNALFSSYGLPRSSSTLELIRNRGNAAFQSVDLFERVLPASSVAYPSTNLGKALQLTARVLTADIGTDLAWVSAEGFDTHGLQALTHGALLNDLSESLAAFHQDLVIRGLSDEVIVLAWSEFGRRVSENGNKGTDHGKAGTVFLIGDGIKGGTFYGDVPDLSDLDDGDLKTHIDFRSVYWTVIQDWFGRDPLPVLQAKFENLGFVQTAKRGRVVRH